ncbi:hypothetical protein EYR40_005070 [Pleurotus pulmonarius]|nr:hypothetical protein EYR36_006553 [Pleurotus pulmonarius]KAF4601252.1 hypothetical protein EYR38_005904 [Pleurotus pulmonarius]KAF4601870.1 hypothetical protein EYR40_005070 [Pleurotus pulmonarius]
MSGATAVLYPSHTPASYHRIVSQTLTIPTDPLISVPVGLLACQRDPLLRELSTTVVNCLVSQPAAPPAGKKSKKSVIAPILPQGPILQLILHDTVIFPEGGGQPTDTGVIIDSDGEPWQVLQCKRDGGHAVHYVNVGDSIEVDAAIAKFTPGTKVIATLDQAAFDRRYDHMSMHTSQHLLSALLETDLNLPTLSWSLTTYPSPCYVEIPRGMSPEEITKIQERANRLVFEGRKVHIEVTELDNTEAPSVPTLQDGRAVGKALPQDYTGGVKRVVVIDGVDRNPCCGTHMPTLHNLQLFIIPHTEALSRSSTTTARLYFLCGPRLIAYLTSAHSLLTSTASIMSCGAPLVPERVSQVIDDRRRAEKRVDALETELAATIASGLVVELKTNGVDQLFKKSIHRTDDSLNPLAFLNAILLAFSNALPPSAPYLCVLSSSPSSSSSAVVLVIGSDEKLVKQAADLVKEKVGVKGGGKGSRWSGKFTGAWKRDVQEAAIEGILSGIDA